jgi:hypothetical protein
LERLFVPKEITIDTYKFKIFDTIVELINIYHTLYKPFSDSWKKYQEIEQKIFPIARASVKEVKEVHAKVKGGDRDTNEYVNLEFVDLGILIGAWAIKDLYGTDPKNEKLQLIADITPGCMEDKINGVLRGEYEHKVTYHTDQVLIPNDIWLKRTTFYIYMDNEKIPVMDCFNSTTYEIVPFILSPRKVKVGNDFVLCRFLFIDIWTLRFLNLLGHIPDDSMINKIYANLNTVNMLRDKKNKYGVDYDGVYKDLVVERRKALKEEEKYRPYIPYLYIQNFNKLRIL